MGTRKLSLLSVAVVGSLAIALAVGPSGRPQAAKKCGYPGDVAAGEDVYNGTCIACHGADGKGVVPSAPDFTKSGGVLSKPHAKLVEHIEKGFDSGGGLAMPPRGGDPTVTDQDLADVHAYLHAVFGCG